MKLRRLVLRAMRVVVALLVWAAVVALAWSAISHPQRPVPQRSAVQGAAAPTGR